MHKLGDQWIEIIDGQEHMVKAVNSTYNCNGCAYLCDNGKCLHESIIECPVFRIDAVIKDLGFLRDGCLSSPWDSKVYPLISILSQTKDGQPTSVVVEFTLNGKTMVLGFYRTIQEAKDIWNRRV